MKLFPDNNNHVDLEGLQSELEIFSDQCRELTSLDRIVEKAFELKIVLPLCYKLCTLIQTVPVSVASNERSFSKLKLIKNFLRTTMTDSRLDSLLILSSEKDILEQIPFEILVARWATLKERRIKVA